MRRKFLWLAVAALFLFAAGCSESQTAEKADNPPTESKQHPDKKNSPPSKKEKNEKSASPENEKSKTANRNKKEIDSGIIKIAKATEKIGQQTIHYPRLTLPDEKIESKVNDLIYHDITAYASQHNGTFLAVDYEIMWYTIETLSVLYRAQTKGSENLYAATINLRNGEKITLSNLAEIDKNFVQQLKNSPFLHPKNPDSHLKKKRADVLKYLDSIGTKKLVRALEQADEINADTNPYEIYSCLVGNRILITMKGPRSLGGNILLKVNLD